MNKLRWLSSVLIVAFVMSCSSSQKDIQSVAETSVQQSEETASEQDKNVQENNKLMLTPVVFNSQMPDADALILASEMKKVAGKKKIDDKPAKLAISDETTLKWINAALNGDETGMFILAMMYRINSRIKDDAIFKLSGERTVKKECAFRDDYEQVVHEDHDSFHEMLRWIIKLEDESSAFSELLKSPTLIYHLPKSLNVPKDGGAEAFKWLENMASHEFADAEYLLAILYLNGVMTDVDIEKGVLMMRRAAIHGLDVAQYNLAMMYKFGIHIPEISPDSPDWMTFEPGADEYWLKQAAASHPSAMLYTKIEKIEQTYKNGENVNDILRDGRYTLKKHAWYYLLVKGNFSETCKYNYDEGNIGQKMSGYYLDDLKLNECFSNYWNDEIIPGIEDSDYEEEGCNDEDREYESDDMDDPECVAAYEIYQQINEREYVSMHYSIDYALDNAWLTKEAENENKVYFRQLRALTLAGKGCRGVDESGNPLETAKSLILSGMNENNASEKYFQIGNLYYVDEGNYEKAFEYYKKSSNEGNLNGKKMFYLVLSRRDPEEILYKINLENPDVLAYDSLVNDIGESCGMEYASLFAGNIVQKVLKNKSSSKNVEIALKWFYRFVEHRFGDYEFYERSDLGMLLNQMLELLVKNDGNLSRIGVDKSFIEEWWRRLYEVGSHETVAAELAKLPMITGLEQSVKDQIALEHGKELKEFYTYKKVKMPYVKGNLSRSELDDIYRESVSKAQTAIVALLLAQNASLDPEIVRNTFWHLAIELPLQDSFMDFCNHNSPVCDDLLNSRLGLDSDDWGDRFDTQKVYRRELFYTWYLRQFPYAAEVMYKDLGLTKKWKKYISEAQDILKSNETLKNSMNYDPRLYMQKLPEADFSQVPDWP